MVSHADKQKFRKNNPSVTNKRLDNNSLSKSNFFKSKNNSEKQVKPTAPPLKWSRTLNKNNINDKHIFVRPTSSLPQFFEVNEKLNADPVSPSTPTTPNNNSFTNVSGNSITPEANIL